MKRNRIMILGLDSATLDLIEPWVKAGHLPHFRRLMEEGVWGQLESTIPPSSASAWSSFATGKNPGKHGLFTFVLRNPDGYTIQSVNGGNRKSAPFWEWLDNQGLRVGVLNMPMTYPPDRLENGFIISGFDTPGLESDFVYPPRLRQLLHRNKYVIDPVERSRTASAQSLFESFRVQKRTFWELKETQPWDVLVLVFMQLDRAQHRFWLDMEAADAQFGGVVFGLYKESDALLGKILRDLDDETALIVMSDHGAGPLRSGVSINQWLACKGYLALKQTSKSKMLLHKVLQQAAKLEKAYLSSSMRSFFRRRFAQIRDQAKSYMLSEKIDWSKTLAFSLGTYEGIFVNLKGRESRGVVSPEDYDTVRDEIAKEILSLCDPGTGQPVIQRVFRREDLYDGPYVDQAPDLMLQWTPGYERYEGVGTLNQYADDIFAPKLIPFTNHVMGGSHRQHGIVMFHGSHFKSGKIQGARIMDLTPTILHLLGMPIPDDMDGRVLTESLDPHWLENHPISYTKGSIFAGLDQSGRCNQKEQAAMEEHLRALGYLD